MTDPMVLIVNRLGVEVANHTITSARLAEAQARIAELESQLAAPTPAEVPT